MKAPERMLDDATMSDRLKVDLARARDNSQVGYDVSTGVTAFRSALEKAASTGDRGKGSEHAAPLFGKPLVLKLIVGGVVASGLYYLLSKQPEAVSVPPAASRLSESSEPEVRQPTLPTVLPLPSATPEEKIQPEAPAPAPARLSQKVRSAMVDEVTHLKQVRLASKSNSQEALRLAKEGHKQYPHGLLHEEREGLLILSLQALGQTEEARTRAIAFESRYPKSALLSQISKSVHPASP